MSSNTVAIIEMLVCLNRGCYTPEQIKEETGLSIDTIRRYIRRLKKKKLIRIGDWPRHGVTFRPVKAYEWNQDRLPDAKMPTPLTIQERQRRSYEKKRARQLGVVVGIPKVGENIPKID